MTAWGWWPSSFGAAAGLKKRQQHDHWNLVVCQTHVDTTWERYTEEVIPGDSPQKVNSSILSMLRKIYQIYAQIMTNSSFFV